MYRARHSVKAMWKQRNGHLSRLTIENLYIELVWNCETTKSNFFWVIVHQPEYSYDLLMPFLLKGGARWSPADTKKAPRKVLCGPAWAWTKDLQIMSLAKWYSMRFCCLKVILIIKTLQNRHLLWISNNTPYWNSLFTHCLRRNMSQ